MRGKRRYAKTERGHMASEEVLRRQRWQNFNLQPVWLEELDEGEAGKEMQKVAVAAERADEYEIRPR